MVFEMVAQGVITEEQARLSAQSNVITRALGIQPDVEVEVHEVPYEKGDRFVLCTDGIHGTMPEKDLIKMLSDKKRKLGAMVDDVATYVDNLGRSSGGGHDNLTLAVVEMSINSKMKTKMTKQAKTIIGGLLALIIISVILNLVQCSSASHKGVVSTSADSCKVLRDSLSHANKTLTSIDSLLQQDKAINSQVKKKVKNIINNSNK